MFYIETKDGDKFFTDPKSNDRLEFEKIIESKLGKDAADMLDNLISEAERINDYTLCDLKDTLDDLDEALAMPELDRDDLIRILSELQKLCYALQI